MAELTCRAILATYLYDYYINVAGGQWSVVGSPELATDH